jgi:hypothetical protein
VRQPARGFLRLEETEQYKRAKADLQQATRKQVAKRQLLLFTNPAHPSLQTHHIMPDKHYWEAYVNRGDRIIYIPEGDRLVLVDVVSHDDIGRYGK